MFAWRPRRPSSSSLLVGTVCAAATAPAWIVRHPPLQDLPLHAAALRVIHDFSHPGYAFPEYFELALHKTAYVLTYLLGSVLADVVGVHAAIVALVALYLGGTPLALRSLLRALHQDERLTVFAVPLLYSAMYLLGLLPFVLGIPFMFWSMAAAIRYLEQPTWARGVLLSLLGVALFFCHVFPFAVFGLVYALVFPWTSPRSWLRSGAPALPALVSVAWWSTATRAGTGAAQHLASGSERTLSKSLAHFPRVTTDVFRDHSDEVLTLSLLVLIAATWLMARREERPRGPFLWRYALIVPMCLGGYFLLGNRLGDVYLVADRLPALAVLCAVPLLRLPTGGRGWVASLGAAALALCVVVNVCIHFRRFEEDEVGAFDSALAELEPGRRMVGLMFDRSSRITRNSPFLHFVSYYQAEKGGLVMFTYAGFPHWPFQFRSGRFPPPGRAPRLGWEWGPQRVGEREIHPYYDYVLARGGKKKLPRRTHTRRYKDEHWTVWEKKARPGRRRG